MRNSKASRQDPDARRAAKFGLARHESEAAREQSFKRATELCDWAISELVRAGRGDAARALLKAIDTAERVAQRTEIPQEETAQTTGHSD